MPTFFFDSLKVFRNKEARTVVVFSVVENEKHRLEGRTTIIARRFFFRETTRRLSGKRRKVFKGFSFPSIFFSLLFFFLVFVFFLSLDRIDTILFRGKTTVEILFVIRGNGAATVQKWDRSF